MSSLVPDYVKRLIDEEELLSLKMGKLSHFLKDDRLHRGVAPEELEDMKIQEEFMTGYLNVIRRRLRRAIRRIGE